MGHQNNKKSKFPHIRLMYFKENKRQLLNTEPTPPAENLDCNGVSIAVKQSSPITISC